MQNYAMRGGLYVPEQPMDERAVQAALKDFDDRLILSHEVDSDYGCYVYVVVRRWSNEHPASVICEWRDDSGRPLPLSHRLLEKVQRLHVAARVPYEDALAHNDRIKEAVEREMEEAADAAARDAVNRRGRLPVFHRSQGLARTRARLRANGLDS